MLYKYQQSIPAAALKYKPIRITITESLRSISANFFFKVGLVVSAGLIANYYTSNICEKYYTPALLKDDESQVILTQMFSGYI